MSADLKTLETIPQALLQRMSITDKLLLERSLKTPPFNPELPASDNLKDVVVLTKDLASARLRHKQDQRDCNDEGNDALECGSSDVADVRYRSAVLHQKIADLFLHGIDRTVDTAVGLMERSDVDPELAIVSARLLLKMPEVVTRHADKLNPVALDLGFDYSDTVSPIELCRIGLAVSETSVAGSVEQDEGLYLAQTGVKGLSPWQRLKVALGGLQDDSSPSPIGLRLKKELKKFRSSGAEVSYEA